MNIDDLSKDLIKGILKTSQGFSAPSQRMSKRTGGRIVRPAAGHPLSSHLSGVASTQFKTKFCSLGDMVEAFWLLLNTPAGKECLKNITPGRREPALKERIGTLFPIEGQIQGLGKVKFNRNDLVKGGLHQLPCVAVLEGRERAGRVHLHVQTFYPELSPAVLWSLLDAKTSPR